jgi:hypothetical protein
MDRRRPSPDGRHFSWSGPTGLVNVPSAVGPDQKCDGRLISEPWIALVGLGCIWLANWDCTKSVKRLVMAQADPNMKANDGRTPLHFAIQNPEMVKLLLDHGASVSAQNADGENCASFSSTFRKRRDGKIVVEQILEVGGACTWKLRELMMGMKLGNKLGTERRRKRNVNAIACLE